MSKKMSPSTALEYILNKKEMTFSFVGKQLSITPQQFSDWIKKRRPIPEKRLSALSEYLHFPKHFLADSYHFARELDSLLKIEIKILLVKEDERDDKEREEKIALLEKEMDAVKLMQRLEALLRRNDPKINGLIDALFSELESWIE
ncbi:hypothetical protein [Metabacillus sp. RGM 3146]|uniref:hypothetical protein n=1 Tax=Metabacillus sp. RGM 3146 TaxID=3401092 RepID=UPI003B9C2379